MAANNIVKTEVIKGERDDIIEEYPRAEKKRTQNKLRSKISSTRIAKRNVPRFSTRFASARIVELARPTKQHALNTLNEKMMTLPPAFVDNLVKIIEAEFCLTPEEAAQVRHRKERGLRKAMRSPLSLEKKPTEKIMEDTMLDRDATMCQYLIAERFVKSILEYRREMRESNRKIAQVIMKRLMSIDGYADAKNDDRATQQLWFLADVVASWITDILVEVDESREEALKEYDKKRQMKRLQVNDDNKTKNLEQMDQIEVEKNYEIAKRNNPRKEKNEEEQKEDENDKESDKAEEKTTEREAKSESVRKETSEKEQKNEETEKIKREEKIEKTMLETEDKEEENKDATMEE